MKCPQGLDMTSFTRKQDNCLLSFCSWKRIYSCFMTTAAGVFYYSMYSTKILILLYFFRCRIITNKFLLTKFNNETFQEMTVLSTKPCTSSVAGWTNILHDSKPSASLHTKCIFFLFQNLPIMKPRVMSRVIISVDKIDRQRLEATV